MLMFSLSAQDADVAMCRCEGGVELALQYAKMWCRYAKDLLTWIDKRISLGECELFSLGDRNHQLYLTSLHTFAFIYFNLHLTSPYLSFKAYLTLHTFTVLYIKNKTLSAMLCLVLPTSH